MMAAVGCIVYFFHDKLHWNGRLPGDMGIEKKNFRFYFSIATSILPDLLLSAIVWGDKKIILKRIYKTFTF